MDCPACERMLSPIEMNGMRADVCRTGCGGVWLDRFELQKVDRHQESAGAALLRYQPDLELEADKAREHVCPRDGASLMRHFFHAERDVEVDTCPQCAGVWLDAGELTRLQFGGPGGASDAGGHRLLEEFGPQLDAMRRASPMARTRAETIERALRWISPSEWIPRESPAGDA